jgi:serine/threonine-protein kinase ATR
MTITARAQYAPDAGLIKPFTTDAVVTVSSGDNARNIADRKTSTFWESANPLPDHFIRRHDLNIFLDQQTYDVNLPIDKAVDGNMNTKATIVVHDLVITFKKPRNLIFLSVKYQTNMPVSLIFYSADKKKVKTATLKPENNFRLTRTELNEKIAKIEIRSQEAFSIFEMAALKTQPTEFVLIDLKEPQPVGQIWARALNDKEIKKIEVLTGNDPDRLTPAFTIDPTAIPLIPYLLPTRENARFIKVVFTLPVKDYYKVKLWEFDVYDQYGPYGKPPAPNPSEATYGESFGINTVWGWGYNVYSDLIPKDKGPWVFDKITTLARIYHRLDWDINNPQQKPGYSDMGNGNGTKANSWLDWDREYDLWKKTGFDIDACIMFNNDFFPDTLWKKPYSEALDLGKAYASHFVRNRLISLIEVGNEPWNYDQHIYRRILNGFSDGAKSVSQVTVLPCAVQAYDPYSEANNYITHYLDKEALKKIDGLNTHVYNYIFDRKGNRKAVNPEDPRAEIWSVANLKKYMDVNMPGKAVYVTEFGYDSEGGGEDCTHPVCVSEHEQAIYGIRSALILFRLGIRQFYWYYFSNVAYTSFLHNRAGLTASSGSGFKKKESYYAFKTLYSEMKDFRFEKVIAENDDVFAYQFMNNNNDKVVIAWLPSTEEHHLHKWVAFPTNTTIKEIIPVTTDKKATFEQNRVYLSGTPVILKIIQ